MTKKESKLDVLKDTLQSLNANKKELMKDKTHHDRNEEKVSPIIEVQQHHKDELIPDEHHHY